MKKATNFILGAIFGGIIGGAVVILLAPSSGEETRLAFREKFVHLRKELVLAIQEKRAELQAELENLKNIG